MINRLINRLICTDNRFENYNRFPALLNTTQPRSRGVQIKHKYLKVWIENCTHMHTQVRNCAHYTLYIYILYYIILLRNPEVLDIDSFPSLTLGCTSFPSLTLAWLYQLLLTLTLSYTRERKLVQPSVSEGKLVQPSVSVRKSWYSQV